MSDPVWATVTQKSPLRIRFDGDSAALPVLPGTLAGDLEVDQRVLVVMVNRQPVIVGAVGSAQAATLTFRSDYRNTTAGESTFPLRVWRTADGTMCMAGTFRNAVQFQSWAANIQFPVGSISQIPSRDVIVPSVVTIPNVSGGDACAVIIRGAITGSGYQGQPGDVYWQPLTGRTGLSTPAGGLVWSVTPAMW